MEQTDLESHIAAKPASGVATFKALAQHLSNVPASWLKQLVNDGSLPCLRLGSRTLFSVQAVEQKLAELAGKSSPRAKKAKAS